MSQIKPNSGTLWKNTKRTKDTQPTHTGSCEVEGESFWISGWVKESKTQKAKNPKTGKLEPAKFFSLAFTRHKGKATDGDNAETP